MNLQELLGDAYKEDMSVEDIQNALETLELPKDNSSEIKTLKDLISKRNGEIAEYKRKLNEKSTEEEQKAQKEQEERDELQSKYEALLKETEIAKKISKFLSLGYDEKLATETANAFVNGEFDVVFANQEKYQAQTEKRIRAEMLKTTPKPEGGSGQEVMTLDKLRRLSPLERLEFSQKNPQEYKVLYEGGEIQ